MHDFIRGTSLQVDTEVFYPDDDHLIPYITRFRAKHARPLDRAELEAWLSRPGVAA
jgi:hypothetical protein